MRNLKIFFLLGLLSISISLRAQSYLGCIPAPTITAGSCTVSCNAIIVLNIPVYGCFTSSPTAYTLTLLTNSACPAPPIVMPVTPGPVTITNVCNCAYSSTLNLTDQAGTLLDYIVFGVRQGIPMTIAGNLTSCTSTCNGYFDVRPFSWSSPLSFTMSSSVGPPTYTTFTGALSYLSLQNAYYENTSSSDFVVPNACIGSYTIDAKDNRGCTVRMFWDIWPYVNYPNSQLTVQNSQIEYCAGDAVTFNFSCTPTPTGVPVFINMGECQSYSLCTTCTTSKTIIYTYNTPGIYTVTVNSSGACANDVAASLSVSVVDCNDQPNTNNSLPQCMSSFKPSPGDYILSFWVKENLASLTNVITFVSGIRVNIAGAIPSSINVYAYGAFNAQNKIIDGWQKVEQRITIPASATDVSISLINNTSPGVDVYFDDIRFHPFNASFKSYVYDPISLRLSAELDERNYATFYEYDEEGQLIRVKKETEKGIQTIKESRTSVAK